MGPHVWDIDGGDLTLNYWGTTDTDIIDTKIEDFWDFPHLGIAEYLPILPLPAPEAPIMVSEIILDPPSPVGAETVTFTVKFSRPVADTSIDPQVSFGANKPYQMNTINQNGVWLDDKTWQGQADISAFTGDGQQFIAVSGVKDLDGFPILEDLFDPNLDLVDSYIGLDDSLLDSVTRFGFEVITSGTSSMNLQADGQVGKVALSWSSASTASIQSEDPVLSVEDLAGYNVYRSENSEGPFEKINAALVIDNTYTDFDITPDVTYYYLYRIVNTDLEESSDSNVASATPTDTVIPPPTKPVNVNATDGNYTGMVRLSWDNVTGEDSYDVYRCATISTGSCVLIASPTANTTSFDDTGADAGGTIYYYRVRACSNANGCSDISDADSGYRAILQSNVNDELRNIATRAEVRTGNEILIGGFVIRGDTQKCVIVQGLGGSVAVPDGVTRLEDPVLVLKSGQTTIAQNDNWQVQNNPAHVQIIQDAGRAPQDTMEAAIYICLDPGAYTALVTGYLNTTGVGMVAVYDADDGQAYLKNIATRSWVGTNHAISIAGFVIKGDTPKQILIRGLGPSMQERFPSLGALSDPQLRLYKGATRIETNDDWGDADNAAEIGALPPPLPPTHEKEPAILITLEPGLYTAHLLGVGATTGIGNVAVYDLTGR